MAKKRKFAAYRNLERPYTRTSKYRAESFIRMTKNPRIVRWHGGDQKKFFPVRVYLVAKEGLQIRDLALESARQVANRLLEKECGKEGFHLHLRLYPHHVLRENALASGAGADRLSTGMKMSFGKPVGIAAQVKKGQVVLEFFVEKIHTKIAKEAASRAKSKLPGSYYLVEEAVIEKEAKPVVKTPVVEAKAPSKEEVKTQA